jgi:hypothetical protein
LNFLPRLGVGDQMHFHGSHSFTLEDAKLKGVQKTMKKAECFDLLTVQERIRSKVASEKI